MLLTRNDFLVISKRYNLENNTNYTIYGDVYFESIKKYNTNKSHYVYLYQNIKINNEYNKLIFNSPSSYILEYYNKTIKYVQWDKSNVFKNDNTLSVKNYHFTNFNSIYTIPFINSNKI